MQKIENKIILNGSGIIRLNNNCTMNTNSITLEGIMLETELKNTRKTWSALSVDRWKTYTMLDEIENKINKLKEEHVSKTQGHDAHLMFLYSILITTIFIIIILRNPTKTEAIKIVHPKITLDSPK